MSANISKTTLADANIEFSTHEEHAQYAFDSMYESYQLLKNTTLAERIADIAKLRDVLLKNREVIIGSLVAECGKTKTDASIEFLGTLDWLKWVEENANKILAEKTVKTPILLMDKKSKVWQESLGIVLIITPWNYPFHTGMTQIVSAFACGNTVVYKPSEITPMVGVYEAMFAECNVIKQSVYIAYGNGELGEALIDERPEKIFFTGSTHTGTVINQQASEYLIPVDTELGGKDAMIVFDSANVKRVAAAAIWGAFSHSGQSCSAVERLYVEQGIYDDVLNSIVEEIKKLKQSTKDWGGNVDIGRVTVDFQYDIIDNHVQDAISKGATVLSGGKGNRNTLKYEPTVLTDMTHDMLTMQQETFGPVLPIIKFSTESEAIDLANSSIYGLQASIFSHDLKQAERVAKQLEVGGVSINNVNMVEGNPWLSFGGRKQTGSGRARGVEGFLAYSRSKYIIIDSDTDTIEANWYPYTKKKYDLLTSMIDDMFQRTPLQSLKMATSGLLLKKLSQQDRKKLE